MNTNTETATAQTELAVLDDLRGVRDTLTVQRVFGDPYSIDGITIIPVARVAGGGGGGGGGGIDADDAEGHGFGTGFGLGARPIGVYEIHEGQLRWKPAIDADRLARGGQVLAGVAMVCTTLLLLRRRRRPPD
jgi:uncharacterized spore protein YtfJ